MNVESHCGVLIEVEFGCETKRTQRLGLREHSRNLHDLVDVCGAPYRVLFGHVATLELNQSGMCLAWRSNLARWVEES